MWFDELKDLNFAIAKVALFFLAIKIERSQKPSSLKKLTLTTWRRKIILHITAVDIARAELIGLAQHRRARKIAVGDDHVLLPVLFGVELEHPSGDIDAKRVKKDARFPFLRGGYEIPGKVAQENAADS